MNEASNCYYLPEWLARAEDVKLRIWHEERYAHVRWQDEGRKAASPRHKFPKEHKPQLEDVMRDLAILLGVSIKLGEPIFVWVEDAAYTTSNSSHMLQKSYGRVIW